MLPEQHENFGMVWPLMGGVKCQRKRTFSVEVTGVCIRAVRQQQSNHGRIISINRKMQCGVTKCVFVRDICAMSKKKPDPIRFAEESGMTESRLLKMAYPVDVCSGLKQQRRDWQVVLWGLPSAFYPPRRRCYRLPL